MNRLLACSLALLLTLACGRKATSDENAAAAAASAAGSATPAGAGQISDADRAAVLQAARLTPDAKSQVKNECGDLVTPQLVSVELGAAVGPSVLLAMPGGPSLATCYGDGPGLTLFRRADGQWKPIYTSRGAMLVVMKDTHNGAPDIVHGGPGFSHPVFEWNGRAYEAAGREVADERLSDAKFLP